MTTFDRYLLQRFLHVFGILLVTTYGLYIVIDGFSNLDEFQKNGAEESTVALVKTMAVHYRNQAFVFFDTVGPMAAVIAAVMSIALLQRNGELNPILSARVPTYRLVIPLLIGSGVVSLLLTINQEVIFPQIAAELQADRSEGDDRGQQAEPAYDRHSHVLIAGSEVIITRREMRRAQFVLPVPEIASTLTTLRADSAFYFEAAKGRPSGWLLENPTPRFDDIPLTAEGVKYVRPIENSNDLFVVSEVSVDQICNRSGSFRYLSTKQLLDRIRNPAIGASSIRRQVLHLHERMTRPINHLIGILLAIPVVVRKESYGLIMNVAMSIAVLAVAFAVTQACLYLGSTNIISAEAAVWLPLIACGTASAWMSGMVQT